MTMTRLPFLRFNPASLRQEALLSEPAPPVNLNSVEARMDRTFASMKLLPDNLGYISEQEDFIVKVIVQNSRILSAMLFRHKSGIPSHAVNFDKEGLDITFLGWSVKKLRQEVEIIENASKAQGDTK